MSIIKDSITGYVDANEKQLIGKAIIGGKTAGLLNLQTGVKGSAYLNLLDADPTLQAGGCGWNPEGSTTLTRRTIETGLIKVNMPFCDKDLIGTSMQYDVKVAVGAKTLPFEQDFIEQNIKAIQAKLEKALWQGDKTEGDHFDGLIKIIGDATGVIDAGNGNAVETPMDAVKAVVANLPNEIMDRADKVIFAGYDVFRAYVTELQEKNLYHYTADLDGANMEMVIPGTDIKLIGVAGLIGTGKLYGTYLENVYLGTDLEGDAEKFLFWYSEDNSEFRLKVEFNAGVQVAFPDFIVKYEAL